MATTGRHQRLAPAYKQHTAVCDQAGVTVDVEATTGELNEGGELVPAIERVEAVTGTAVAIASADAGYAYAKVYGALERRGITAVIPPKAEPIRSPVPMRRFRYDARHDRLTCPRGKALKPGRRVKHGRFFTARARDCRRCDLARLCLSGGRVNKAVVVGDDYAALLRARRRRERWSDHDKAVYTRHRWRVEGVHGEAKTRHGLVRAVRRGPGAPEQRSPQPDAPSSTAPAFTSCATPQPTPARTSVAWSRHGSAQPSPRPMRPQPTPSGTVSPTSSGPRCRNWPS